jgi:DNA-binding transcriptional LysR family regulator
MRSDLALTVPRVFADFVVSRLPVKYLQLPFEVPNLETYLYWHESTDQDQSNRWMRELILSLPAKLSWN